jgi:hypothetical protein
MECFLHQRIRLGQSINGSQLQGSTLFSIFSTRYAVRPDE